MMRSLSINILPISALLLSLVACEKGGGTPVEVVPDPGSVQLTLSTTGRAPDRDGYSITLDGSTKVAVPSNGSATLPALAAGSHTVVISGVNPNCTVGGAGTLRTVNVQSNAATPVEFAVQCVADRIAYYQGLGTFVGMGLFVAKRDGTEAVELKRGFSLGFGRMDWSPDGSSILYVSGTGDTSASVWSIDVFTRDSTRITTEGQHLHPQWSPTGDRIAATYIPAGPYAAARVAVMNANGSGRRTLTGYTGDMPELMPTWSPDGNSIAYQRGPQIRIVDVDGTGDRLVTEMGWDGHTHLAWSPDGAWLVWYARDPTTSTTELFRVHPDGSGRAAITATPTVWEEGPSFMPDGRIIFTAMPSGQSNYDPWAIAVDGSGLTRLLSTPTVVERLTTWQ